MFEECAVANWIFALAAMVEQKWESAPWVGVLIEIFAACNPARTNSIAWVRGKRE